jgi:TatA/E family protein of Tat protein translocase
MLAFLNNPVEWMFILIVALVVFGPQKLPEIGRQLGQALRELRRSTQEFTSQMHGLDDDLDRYDSSYNTPRRYDNYDNGNGADGNRDYGYRGPFSDRVNDETPTPALSAGTNAPDTTANATPPRGDFAAAAFADTSSDYGASGTTAPGKKP